MENKNDIVVSGIKTNNLKNITIRIKKNKINLIIGPSGSGKSSLAYDTIAQIGQHEFDSIYADNVCEPNYKVDSYSNMIITIPIKQLNLNTNVRSTIGTYFSLNICLAKIFSSILELPYDYFILNKSENVCPICGGIGFKKELDPNKIVNYDIPIKNVPIRCWNKNKDFYRKILQQYCDDIGISTEKTFRKLSEEEKEMILFGKSTKKYMIKYMKANCVSTRTTQYMGVMTNTPMLRNFSPSNDFYFDVPCENCKGEKYSTDHRKHLICGESIGSLMLVPFNQLSHWLFKVHSKYSHQINIDFSLNQLISFVEKANDLDLGHLFLNRNIPSLSGGELQRLKLVKIFSSQLTDMLIILDEPLAGLSFVDLENVYKNIISLADRHTLLIIDHHTLFYNDAANIIALGIGSGKQGGSIIDEKKYIESQCQKNYFSPKKPSKFININLQSKVYSYVGAQVKIAYQCTNVISGASGVGKSTLLREYFSQFFDSYSYVNQKPIIGKSHSIVATDLDIFKEIIDLFCKKYQKERSYFSNMNGAKGACQKCGGTGIVTYGSENQSQIILNCKDCDGTGFNPKLSKYQINNITIMDILKMTIDEAYVFFTPLNSKVAKKLKQAQELLLGHLQIGEKTSSLSGGENLRVKLLKVMNTNKQTIAIDEPFRGLNSCEIYQVVRYLNKLSDEGKTVIVVAHEEEAFSFFANHIILKNKNGVLCDVNNENF
ncbi:MAG: ATP-binding cassette domain-containing protein [Oscillospiraceae bacterium]|nr:ATP-binding cassette domain-containing protein [Oscillospiraceae bacterium]